MQFTPSSHKELITPQDSSVSTRNFEFADQILFPQKLYTMMTEESPSIIAWISTRDAFIILDKEKFKSEVIPKYFMHTNFASFLRQLSVYGFRRITRGEAQGAYVHPKFKAGNPELVAEIRRVVNKQRRICKSALTVTDSDVFPDFDLDTSIFPEGDDVHDLFFADLFSLIPDDELSTSFIKSNNELKRKSEDEVVCDSDSCITSKRTKLDQKLIASFEEEGKLVSENNLEKLEALMASTTLPDIKVNFCSPGFHFEDVGIQSLFRFYETMGVIFPDFILNEGNARLAEDKSGTYIVNNFHFTGTQTVQTEFDHMFFNETGFLGQIDNSEISAEKVLQLKEIEKALKENKRIKITSVGMCKYYIDLDANMFRAAVIEWKVEDFEIDDGEKIVILPLNLSSKYKEHQQQSA